ncbi:MAG TPA: putative Ig domain-containing protein [Burkholderiaceae bacterium]
MSHFQAPTTKPALALIVALVAGSLTACGGGNSATSDPAAADSTSVASPADAGNAAVATVPASTDASSTPGAADDLDPAVAAQMAQASATPVYHMAPVQLDEPPSIDAGGTNASARSAPLSYTVDPNASDLDTAGLTPQRLAQHLADAAGRKSTAAAATTGDGRVAPAATALKGMVFTPAQIRAAYGMTELPVVGASLSAAAAAALGAGQTIYIIDAYHDATALADLNRFSSKFGLPSCRAVSIATTAALPLGKPAASGCDFSVVYANSAGGMNATAPARNSTWTPESKLDVQWAHAIAPLARILLIETPDAMSNNLLGGITLANKMGAGVLSMSFGLADPGWSASVDSRFTTTGMTYVAAAGDIGAQVDWPAVSPNVLAVGGTGLNWSGAGSRYEQAWARSGGGISAYEALPSYQSALTVAGGGHPTRRAVSDVAFNANPMTGQYVALTAPGSTTTTWSAFGGTSISSPQWAGILAVANAIRAANSKPALGNIHPLLYSTIGAVPGTYASAFSDIVDGSNGTCSICSAGAGFDTSTGWGTPNVANLLPVLTGTGSTTVAAAPAAAPTVPGGLVVGRNGIQMVKTLGIKLPAGTKASYSMTGGPSGTSLDQFGDIWYKVPVAGTYNITVRATTTAGGTATGNYTIKIIPNTNPTITSSTTLSATAGAAFSTTLRATNPNTGTLSFSATGLPSGATMSRAGVLSWPSPVAGTRSITAKVTDSYGNNSSTVLTLTVR